MANKLELTWYGKENQVNVEPRIIIEDKTLSNVVNGDSENMLIHGDNLLALKALEKDYAGKIKCIYIDPPYNTGNAFSSYEDGLEHSIWLSLMRERLILLRRMLSPEGLICIQIDNSPNSRTQQTPESPYLNVLCDEIFGRQNYMGLLVWKKKGNASNTASGFGIITESILVYAFDKSKCVVYKEEFDKHYKYKDSNGEYNLELFTKTDSGEYKRDTMKFDIIDPSTGIVYKPPFGKRWTFGQQTVETYLKKGLIIFQKGMPYFKHYRDGVNTKLYNNLLLEHGSLKSAKEELVKLGFDREEFETPKPEILIKTILDMFSCEGDYVLDSFLGSGTTAAVAHKMGRRYIGVEMGQQAYTFCKQRIDKVVDGEQGGISKAVNWQGGGGYRFYELAPTLINEDAFGQKVISTDYNSDMLAAAIALHEGYKYEPDNTCYWKQSHSENNSYLFVTTNHISREIIDSIKTELKDDEFLLISCKSFDTNAVTGVKNISIKKIPQSLLTNCEFGVDNYSLNIVSPPVYEEESDDE